MEAEMKAGPVVKQTRYLEDLSQRSPLATKEQRYGLRDEGRELEVIGIEIQPTTVADDLHD